MNKFFSHLSIAFTICALLSSINNILQGYDGNGFCAFLLELFLFMILAQGLDRLISLINFKSFQMYFFSETLLLYPAFIGSAWLGHWFSFRIENLIRYTVIYLLAMLMLHMYYYTISKKQADTINQILKRRGTS